MMAAATLPVVETTVVGVDGWCHTYCGPDHFICGANDQHPDVEPHCEDGPPGPVCGTCGLPKCPTCEELWAAEPTICKGCGATWLR